MNAVATLMVWLAAFAPAVLAAQSDIDHSPWDYLMRRYVTPRGVDYDGLRADQAAVEQYLASLSAVEVNALPSAEAKLAFWINAYNAYVVKGVLDHQPLRSVKEVKGFFDRIRYPVAGESLTLNEIEARGRALGDWRIHFAVVCASSSCPPLRAEAYQPGDLDAQLIEQTGRFLSDPQRGLRVEGGTLWLSRVFDWYAEDFVSGGRVSPAGLLSVLKPHLDQEIVGAMQAPRLRIRYLPYDWTLNAKR